MKRSVVLIVMDTQSRVLLLKRPEHHTYGSEWCFPGGKVDYIVDDVKYQIYGTDSHGTIKRFETDDEACVRECIEETGYVPAVIQDTLVTASDGKYLVKVFVSHERIEENEVTKKFPNREHTEYRFFALNELPEDIGKLTNKILKHVQL